MTSTISAHIYGVRPRKDHRGADLISDALPFGLLWYGESDAVSNAVGYAKFCGSFGSQFSETRIISQWIEHTGKQCNAGLRVHDAQSWKKAHQGLTDLLINSLGQGSLNWPACLCVSITVPAES